MMRTGRKSRKSRLLSLILVCVLSLGTGLVSRQAEVEGRARPAGYTVHYNNGTTRTGSTRMPGPDGMTNGVQRSDVF